MVGVGGLPVQELNQLEIEFLIYNDFNLVVSNTELQRTGDMLMEFRNSRIIPPVMTESVHEST